MPAVLNKFHTTLSLRFYPLLSTVLPYPIMAFLLYNFFHHSLQIFSNLLYRFGPVFKTNLPQSSLQFCPSLLYSFAPRFLYYVCPPEFLIRPTPSQSSLQFLPQSRHKTWSANLYHHDACTFDMYPATRQNWSNSLADIIIEIKI